NGIKPPHVHDLDNRYSGSTTRDDCLLLEAANKTHPQKPSAFSHARVTNKNDDRGEDQEEQETTIADDETTSLLRHHAVDSFLPAP
ncbi:unnamed protein product, partial [Amoebophrya sp. A120]